MKILIFTDSGNSICFQGKAISILKKDQTAWIRDHLTEAAKILGLS